MKTYESAYDGELIRAGGEAIAPGATVDLSADEQKHPAVAEWIEAGWLTPVAAKSKAKAEAPKPGDKAEG